MALRRNRIVLIVLTLVAAASLWRTVLVQREKNRISSAYDEAKQMVDQLETERTQLSQELSGAKQAIAGQTTEVKGLQEDLQRVQDRLDRTVVELSSLQREHEQVRQQNSSLTTQLSSIATEKQQLEAKLSDIKQLRLAIHGVRQKIWRERFAAWRAHIQTLKEEDQRALAAGNRGYVVRDGRPTLATGQKQTLQVHVLEPQSVP